METMNEASIAASQRNGTLTGFTAREAFHETRGGWIVLGIIWVASAAYLGARLRLAWAPLDAGPLAQMADRVLRGQVPFRDFIELYTGGLDYLNALAFRLFGVNFLSLRLMMFPFFLGWVPSVYFIARRFTRPLGAGAVTLLAVAWGPAAYPEAMACWYNLFFATWGILALIRYAEDEKKRWLWVAGLCAGLSFLVKIIGLYFVAAVLLFLVFREQALDRHAGKESRPGGLWYRLFVAAGLILFLASLVNLISWVPTAANYVQFVLPSACLVGGLLWATWREKTENGQKRFRHLISAGLPFLAGALAPVSTFLLWLATQKALGDWVRGVFITPTTRLEWASYSPPLLATSPGLLPVLLIVVLAFDSRRWSRRLVRFSAPAVLATTLFAAHRWPAAYTLAGYSTPLLIPFLALAGTLHLGRPKGAQAQKVFLVVSAAVLCALVQFPADSANYFNYVAPLVILAFAALASTRPNYESLAAGSLLAFYLVFALWLGTPGYWFELRLPPGDHTPLATLNLSRAGGILMKPREAHRYEALVPLVREHAHGPYIYCAPDCPEVYFLSRKHNPTGSINDFLDPDFTNIPARTHRILRSIRDHRVNVVVFQERDRGVSGSVSAGLRAALDAHFPDSQRVGGFEVRWLPRERAVPALRGQTGCRSGERQRTNSLTDPAASGYKP